MPGSALDRIPGGYELLAAGVSLRREARGLWIGSPLHHWLIARPRPEGLGAQPKDLRPADPDAGRRILAGGIVLGGETLAFGPRGDPWDRPSPSRRFAAALHQFGWVNDLTALGEDGAFEALRLTLEWRRLFGNGRNVFSWSPKIVERRTFNLACAARSLGGQASDAETAQIAADLARQARLLLALDDGPVRSAERAVVAAVAASALGGRVGAALLERSLGHLRRVLPQAITPDGGHASRSPQAALELLFDLTALDDALVQRGIAAPDEMMRALDGLAAAVRFFTLADGGLAAFQGGEALNPSYVAAARAQDDLTERAVPVARNGYQRLEAASLQVMADAAAPATGPWSVAACAQPLAIAVLVKGRPLIVGSGWSPQAHGPQALRLVDAASTAAVGDAPCGEPLIGFPAEALGLRLRDADGAVQAGRHEGEGALWLDLAHDGWVRRFGLRHERRLYLDLASGELRGEDSLAPVRAQSGPDGRRFVRFVVRFHLHPDVSALIARDRKSVLLKAGGDETGWWLRNDALEVALEPSVHFQHGEARRSQQIVLRGQARLDAGARVRWKLSAARTGQDGRNGDESHIDGEVARA